MSETLQQDSFNVDDFEIIILDKSAPISDSGRRPLTIEGIRQRFMRKRDNQKQVTRKC